MPIIHLKESRKQKIRKKKHIFGKYRTDFTVKKKIVSQQSPRKKACSALFNFKIVLFRCRKKFKIISPEQNP